MLLLNCELEGAMLNHAYKVSSRYVQEMVPRNVSDVVTGFHKAIACSWSDVRGCYNEGGLCSARGDVGWREEWIYTVS